MPPKKEVSPFIKMLRNRESGATSKSPAYRTQDKRTEKKLTRDLLEDRATDEAIKNVQRFGISGNLKNLYNPVTMEKYGERNINHPDYPERKLFMEYQNAIGE